MFFLFLLPPRKLLSYMHDDSLSSPAVESHTYDMQATPLDLLDSANLPADDMTKPNFYETHDFSSASVCCVQGECRDRPVRTPFSSIGAQPQRTAASLSLKKLELQP